MESKIRHDPLASSAKRHTDLLSGDTSKEKIS